MSGTVLVTGGAGYIGSHCVLRLLEAGGRVVVLDDLSAGAREAIPEGVPFVQADAGDRVAVRAALDAHKVEAVIHFAAHVVVPESVNEPLRYYRNNVAATGNLVAACLDVGVSRFVFSSSAAVYGEGMPGPVPESAATRPVNPYGETKLVAEWMLRDVSASPAGAGFRHVCLRYFNVAGARRDGLAGQRSRGATHLVKVAAEAACGKRPMVTIFGTDYPTPDGTAIRDYIHVEDLVEAHLAALRHLGGGGASGTYNCGYGRGHSVRAVLSTMQEVSGVRFQVIEGPRRAGDPAQLVADASRLRADLGWAPRADDLRVICETAYRWERGLP